MEKHERVESFAQLCYLIELYSLKRDLPVDEETENFFEKFEENCKQLELDVELMKKRFQIYQASDL